MTVVEQTFGVYLIFQLFQRITEWWNIWCGKGCVRIIEFNSEVNGPCEDQTLNLGIYSILLSPFIWSLRKSNYSRAYSTPFLDTSNKKYPLLSSIQFLNYQLFLGQVFAQSPNRRAKAKHCLNHQNYHLTIN